MMRRYFPRAGLALLIAATAAAVPAQTPGAEGLSEPSKESPDWWYRQGALQAARNEATQGRARNVIVFLGDGMSLTTVAAARILEGQRLGGAGEDHVLAWERFPYTGLGKTYNTDSQTPDSAGTMTAIATGVKTHMGAIGVAAGNVDDCADSHSKHALSWLRLGASAGMATGVVTTARLTHATPAATYAHAPNRRWEGDADLSDDARSQGCRDIARQLAELPPTTAPQVLLGGGRSRFLPLDAGDPEYPALTGQRRDGRNLVQEWLQAYPGSRFVWNREQLQQARGGRNVLGLFEPEHMQYEHDRERGPAGDPDLAEMTRFAIGQLASHEGGFVMLVEGARIDHAHHAGNAYRALDETISLARAVEAALEATSREDTLILVTADHSHTLGFVGYPRRGNPILGTVRERPGEDGQPGAEALDALGLPYTTLVYANGAGNTGASGHQAAGPKWLPHKPRDYVSAAGRPDLRGVDTTHPDYLQEALVPMWDETHGGEDVGIWAIGPGSHAVRGTMEQNALYHIIVQAVPALRDRLCSAGTCDGDGLPVRRPDPADFPGR